MHSLPQEFTSLFIDGYEYLLRTSRFVVQMPQCASTEAKHFLPLFGDLVVDRGRRAEDVELLELRRHIDYQKFECGWDVNFGDPGQSVND